MRPRIHKDDAAKTAAHLARLQEAGGVRRTVAFTGDDVKAIASLRERWGMDSDRAVISRALAEAASKDG